MIAGSNVTLVAPAKINLGLEILGRRRDGFHEIRTVMAMVTLCDTLTVAPRGGIAMSPVEGVEAHENLIDRALMSYRSRRPQLRELGWSIDKRIPIASGLGGASSDAAAMLRAANLLCPEPLRDLELHELAAGIGSDVPFFLHGPTAVAKGRGTELEAIVAPSLDALLIVPRVELFQKTRLLYSLLESSDYTDGSRTDAVVDSVTNDRPLSSDLLQNAFSRALCDQVPRIKDLQYAFEREFEFPWGLSGAGPSHYVIAPRDDHESVLARLEEMFPGWLRTYRVTTLVAKPETKLGCQESR